MSHKPTSKELAGSVADKLDKIGDITRLTTDIITAVINAQNKADQAFQSASDGLTMLETTVIGKGGTVSKAEAIASYNEIATGIQGIPAGGVDTSDANAIESDLKQGTTAYVNGVKITGTMPNKGAVIITPSEAEQTIPAGYHNGLGKVLAAAPAAVVATGTVTAVNSYVSVSGLPFRPKRIYVWLTTNPETSGYYNIDIDTLKYLQITYAGARWYALTSTSSSIADDGFNLKMGAYPTGTYNWRVEG